MSRRCLICADINPCGQHSADVQEAELARNIRAIGDIQGTEARLTAILHEKFGVQCSLPEMATWRPIARAAIHALKVPRHDD